MRSILCIKKRPRLNCKYFERPHRQLLTVKLLTRTYKYQFNKFIFEKALYRESDARAVRERRHCTLALLLTARFALLATHRAKVNLHSNNKKNRFSSKLLLPLRTYFVPVMNHVFLKFDSR